MSQHTDDALSQSLAKISANYQSSNTLRASSDKVTPTQAITKAGKIKTAEKTVAELALFNDQIFCDLKWDGQSKQALNLINCEFHHCDFSHAALDFMQANGCTFYECNFKNSSLKEAVFEKCSFFASETQKGCYFYGADLVNSQFKHCDLSLAEFERADMFGIEISNSKAQGSSFKQANFASVVSRRKLFSSAFLTDSHFRYADFEGCHLASCDLSGSSFVNANFFQTNLEKALLINADLSGIQFERLALAGADLRNAQLDGLDIRKVDLQGVKISDWQQSVLLESLGVICFPD